MKTNDSMLIEKAKLYCQVVKKEKGIYMEVL